LTAIRKRKAGWCFGWAPGSVGSPLQAEGLANIKIAVTLAADEPRSFFEIFAHRYLRGLAMRFKQ